MMNAFFLLAALIAVQPAAQADAQPAPQPDATPPAPPVGQRTAPPETLLGGLDVSPSAGEDDPAVAAAAAYPLGSLENPVRVGGPEGERAYLARLRCSDGSTPQLGARSDRGVGAFGSNVAGYPVQCGAGPAATVILDMYHEEHREDQAPPGFTLVAR